MTDSDSDRHQKLRNILEDLANEEQRLLSEVLRVEQEKLHMKNPKVTEDIWKAIVETIQ